ncbi:MAG TPA: hypothetical protein VGF48_08700 [Thermoanaerobaculia bacterium]
MLLLRPIAAFLALAISIGVHAAGAERGALRVEFRDRAIEISDVTRDGRIVVFGVAREMTNTTPPIERVVRHVQIVEDADGDGVVRYELDRAVPARGMWAFVDLASGASAALPSPGYEPVRLDLAGGAVKHDNAGQLRKLEWPLSELALLLVRPGDGVWLLNTARHARLDENGSGDGPLRIDVAAMKPLGNSSAAPHNFKPGDIVVVMHPRWMEFGLEEVGK